MNALRHLALVGAISMAAALPAATASAGTSDYAKPYEPRASSYDRRCRMPFSWLAFHYGYDRAKQIKIRCSLRFNPLITRD